MIFGQNSNMAALIIGIVAAVLSAYNLTMIYRFNKLRRTFFTGRNGADLEAVIESLYKDLRSLRQEHVVLEQALSLLQERFGFALQKIGVVRFNPFGDDGGNFSFSVALLDGHNTGVVLTSMYGRQQNRIYSKKILNGTSEAALTEEEKQAVMDANFVREAAGVAVNNNK